MDCSAVKEGGQDSSFVVTGSGAPVSACFVCWDVFCWAFWIASVLAANCYSVWVIQSPALLDKFW